MRLKNRIASLELLRFFASISVVIYHYKYVLSGNNPDLVSGLPFNDILNFLYDYGRYGVHIFFTISGFIFAYIYLESNITGRVFFVNRFARLYPLHFLTLMIIVFFQFIEPLFFKEYNQVNNIFNDTYHFILQIFFISSWGLEKGFSFNTPIWSVSIEIVLYIIFFSLIRYLKLYINLLIILILVLSYKTSILNIRFDEYAALFFLGVLTYQISKFKKKKVLLLSSLFFLIFSITGNFKVLIFAPSLILVAVQFDKYIFDKLRLFFVKLGNLTYSTYLIHYPILLLILIYENKFSNLNKIYLYNSFFVTFFVTLILFSHIVFDHFEKPLNKFIRNKLLN